MPTKPTFKSLPASPYLLLVVITFLLCGLLTGTCLATPAPITCDPKGGIWNFGLEWVADKCLPFDSTDSTTIHYINNALVCTASNVALSANYGDDLAPPTDIIGYGVSIGYRVFRNGDGSHILIVHPNYTGLIDGKKMTDYTPGQVYTNVFQGGFILSATPNCKDKTKDFDSCQFEEKSKSTVNIGTGRLSHGQELFSTRGGGDLSLSLTLYYRSLRSAPSAIGNGWSHGYELSLQTAADGSVTFWHEGRGRKYTLTNGVYTAPRGDFSILVKTANGSYYVWERYGLTYNFNAAGQITSLVDRNGNATSFTYANGRLTTVTDPQGKSATFTYDTAGKLTAIADPMGNTFTLTYLNGVLTDVLHPDGGDWNYTYAGNGLISTKTDPAGNGVTYSYNADNRVATATGPQAQPQLFAFSAGTGAGEAVEGRVPDVYHLAPELLEFLMPITQSNGGLWQYKYNYFNETITSTTDPYNNTTSYTYDIALNIQSKTETGIGKTSYTYDVFGNVLSVTDPLWNVTNYTYNNFGQVLTTTGPQGNSSNIYDTNGNLTSSTDSAGTTLTYGYDSKGNLTSITNAKSQTATLTYTTTGLLASITDYAGVTNTFTNDLNGNLLTATGPGGTTTYTYDPMNRPIKVTDPLGNITSFAYDKNGNRTSQTDANGNTTTYKYNYQGQVTEAKDAQGNITTFSYGASGGGACPACSGGVDKLTSLTDAKSQTTSYQYDLMSRLTNEADPLSKATAYSYDIAGNLGTKTDANGATITYTYDSLRRLIQKSYPDTTTESYSYDTAGRIKTAVNKDILYSYSYDTAGKLLKVTDSRGFAFDYEYDILSNRTKTTLQKETPDVHITSYSYDSANRPQTITANAGAFTYNYDSQSRRSSTTYPNGITTSYSYDTLSRLTSIKHASGANTIAFANYSGFDKVGNRKNKTTNAGTENYSYDAVYRLVQAATPNGTEKYSYDNVGNRLTGPGPKDTRYQYDAANRMIMGKVFGHDYDNNGNQTSRTTANTQNKGWTYTWDYENRLIKAEQAKGADKRTVTFKYDPLGRRIQKQLTTIISGTSKTSTWVYVYDSDNVALEIYTNDAGTAEKTRYTHGAGVDEHLALERGGQYYYYHADGLGSVTTITDSGMNVAQNYTYDSFGMPTPGANFRNSYSYTGREWDRETGLYYYRARYYDPIEGRFVSKDSIGLKGGINLYSYVQNNSLNFVDPYGLKACKNGILPNWAKNPEFWLGAFGFAEGLTLYATGILIVPGAFIYTGPFSLLATIPASGVMIYGGLLESSHGLHSMKKAINNNNKRSECDCN